MTAHEAPLRAEDVVREHAPAVYRHLKRIFGPGADVDDLLQNVLLEVVRWLPGFEGRAAVSTWIHRITLSVAYQEMRLRQRLGRLQPLDDDDARTDARVSDDAGAGEAVDAQGLVERKQEADLLYRALASLTAKKRLALTLHEIEGLTLREISELLTIPLQTVASQVRSGRAELADAMHALVREGQARAPRTGDARDRAAAGPADDDEDALDAALRARPGRRR